MFSLGGGGTAVSPDGRELCVVSNHDPVEARSTNGDLWIVPTIGGTMENITASNKAYDGSPEYSPDGRSIAYRTQTVPGYESDLFRIALYDREKKSHETILTEGSTTGSIDRDGRRIPGAFISLPMSKDINRCTTWTLHRGRSNSFSMTNDRRVRSCPLTANHCLYPPVRRRAERTVGGRRERRTPQAAHFFQQAADRLRRYPARRPRSGSLRLQGKRYRRLSSRRTISIRRKSIP